ncbi:MAG: hypothetical protein A3F70_08495 [Acidobacteria bacterium RIFCSPLOWO2_12_FULL_67_14]|nr:MAG: hypothetical protein A3F70_08495 [Acidobacteria bacterium RIFCSPLOWO2_12_FULL_67_14]
MRQETHCLLLRPIPIELSADRWMARRVKRLGFVSVVALGLIWALAVTSLDAPTSVDGALAAGWVLMPAILFGSLSRPRLRYALVLPASLVSVGLLAICRSWMPTEPLAAAGWLSMTTGILLGSALGLWFWYRLIPVPVRLDAPYSFGRWALILVHVALIVAGWGLVAASLMAGGRVEP